MFGMLRARSSYSYQDAICTPAQLAARAAELGHTHLGITDSGSVMGAVELQKACNDKGLQPIFGATLRVLDELTEAPGNVTADLVPRGGFLVQVLVEDEEGWATLGGLLTQASQRLHYGPTLSMDQLLQLQGRGVSILVGGRRGPSSQELEALLQAFGPRHLILGLDDTALPGQDAANAEIIAWATRHPDVPLVAAPQVRYADTFQSPALRVLQASHAGWTIDDPRLEAWSSDQQGLMDLDALVGIYGQAALSKLSSVLPRFQLQLQLGRVQLPSTTPPPELRGDRRAGWKWLYATFPPPAAWNRQGPPPVPKASELDLSEDYFSWYARAGLQARLAGQPQIDREAYMAQLEFELGVILKMRYPAYFLIVAEFINWAKDHRIAVGPGRGSAAGSIVAWAMRITDIDPMLYGLFFERFLNPSRQSMPDIDVDIEQAGRERVIQHVREKYGSEQVSQIATAMIYKLKVAYKDVARSLRVHPQDANRTTRGLLEAHDSVRDALQDPAVQRRLADPVFRRAMALSQMISSSCRQVGVHAGGVIITDQPIWQTAPIVHDPETGRTVVGLDMHAAEDVGLVKFDLLGLKNLDIIGRTLDTIEQLTGERPDLERLDLEDAPTFELLQSGRGLGLFQVESSGMQRLLQRMRPDHIEDVIALVALFRPGPLSSGMVNDYCERKHGRQAVVAPHPKLESLLGTTNGVWVYQEQCMKAAELLAGYTLADADLLRRAIGKKKKKEMDLHRKTFVDGGVERGIDRERMEDIWSQIEGFASYGFNKAHAAAYGMITYWTAWLKTHHPSAFMASVMSLTGKAKEVWASRLQACVQECVDHDIPILPPSLQASELPFVVDGPAIRWGLCQVKGLGEDAAQRLLDLRALGGRFQDIQDLRFRLQTSALNKTALKALIHAGALDEFGPRHALYDLIRPTKAPRSGPGQASLFSIEKTVAPNRAWTWKERLSREAAALGVNLCGHPLDRYRHIELRLRGATISELQELEDRNEVTLVGVLRAIHLETTRGGRPYADLHFADRSGQIRVTCYTDLWERLRGSLEVGDCVAVSGWMSRRGEFQTFRTSRVRKLSDVLTRSTSELRIEMSSEALEGLHALRDLLDEHEAGELGVPVYVKLQSPGFRSTIHLPDRLVAPSEAFFDGAERIFGRTGAVVPIGPVDL